MMLALTIIHVVISVALIVVVLMQHGKQQGLSGAIAGGAETFFGKNKGRTIDAMLKKFTAVIAILFIISSIALAALAINEYKQDTAAEPTETTETGEVPEGAIQVTQDEEGNLVDAESMQAQAEASAEETEAPAEETEAPAEDAEKKAE